MFEDRFFLYLQSVIDIVRVAGNCPVTGLGYSDPITSVWCDLYDFFGCSAWDNC